MVDRDDDTGGGGDGGGGGGCVDVHSDVTIMFTCMLLMLDVL